LAHFLAAYVLAGSRRAPPVSASAAPRSGAWRGLALAFGEAGFCCRLGSAQRGRCRPAWKMHSGVARYQLQQLPAAAGHRRDGAVLSAAGRCRPVADADSRGTRTDLGTEPSRSGACNFRDGAVL